MVKEIWTQKNGTMSDKSARDEFGLTDSEIVQGIKSGDLTYRRNNCHGNPYLKLIRSEVEAFVAKKNGKDNLKKMLLEKELKEINRELNLSKRKIIALEKKKNEILKVI